MTQTLYPSAIRVGSGIEPMAQEIDRVNLCLHQDFRDKPMFPAETGLSR